MTIQRDGKLSLFCTDGSYAFPYHADVLFETWGIGSPVAPKPPRSPKLPKVAKRRGRPPAPAPKPEPRPVAYILDDEDRIIPEPAFRGFAMKVDPEKVRAMAGKGIAPATIANVVGINIADVEAMLS